MWFAEKRAEFLWQWHKIIHRLRWAPWCVRCQHEEEGKRELLWRVFHYDEDHEYSVLRHVQRS